MARPPLAIRLALFLKFLGILGILALVAAPLGLAASQSTLWRVQRVVLAPDATLSQDEAASWLDKPVRITQTSISFEGRTCRVTPQITRVQAGVFLAAHQMTPQELDIRDGTLDLVETGCDIPAFETMLALPEGHFVALYQGAFIFLTQQQETQHPLQELEISEAGLRLRFPESVRVLDPESTPGQGLGLWYKAAPLFDLGGEGYPFDRDTALLDRAALATASPEEKGFAPPLSLPGSLRVLSFGDDGPHAWGKTYAVLEGESPCDVRFTQVLVLYHADWVVQLALAAAPATVIRENPGYFGKLDCGETPHWSNGQEQQAFWSMLRNNGATGLAAAWQEALATLLRNIEISEPWDRPSYVAKNHARCRDLPSMAYAGLFPNTTLVPEQTFGLAFPYGGFSLENPCLATLSDGREQRQAVLAAGHPLQVLPAPPDTTPPDTTPTDPEHDVASQASQTLALGVDDINDDGLPDFLAIVRRLPPQGIDDASRPDNRVYCSRSRPEAPGGVRWSLSPTYGAAVRELPTVADSLLKIRAMRRELRRYIGKDVELQGSVEEQFGNLIFVPEMPPENIGEPARWVIFDPQAQDQTLREPGQRIWLSARILAAEDATPPLILRIQVLGHKLLQPTDVPGQELDFKAF